MSRFSEHEAFVAVVAAGSFTAASERLGVAKSVISRRVSQLETRLGSQLLRRTTRSLTLTDAGRDLHQRSSRVLADLDDAEQSVTASTAALRGGIKLAAPLSFGLKHLSDALARFLQQHPAIELNLDLNDRNINLVDEGFDMAVRIGDLGDSTLISRRLGIVRGITCASKGYLKEHGVPGHPDELQHHHGLQYTNVSYKQAWTFLDASGVEIHARPKIRVRSNNGEALAEAAVAGLGITSAPTFILRHYISRGSLVPILGEFTKRATAIHAVYPPGRLLPRRVRLLTDFLAQRFGEQPYWDRH